MTTDQKPVMHQTWSDLLFLHWRVSAEEIQETLPDGLHVDTYDGSAWIGIVPFSMKNIRPRGLFSVPWISNFLELNVRTYVKDDQGRSGVWFYSLDTNRWIAYKIARIQFSLSYFHAKMTLDRQKDALDYRTIRKGEAKESRFVYSAKPNSQWRTTEPDSLDHFLVERYRLFSHDAKKNRLFTGEVKHPPYEIREAEVPKWDAEPAKWNNLMPLAGDPEHVCIAKTVHVDVFPIERIR